MFFDIDLRRSCLPGHLLNFDRRPTIWQGTKPKSPIIEPERASLKGRTGGEQLLPVRSDEEAQTVRLSVSNELSTGNYELSLDFISSIERLAQGLHVQHYKVDGE